MTTIKDELAELKDKFEEQNKKLEEIQQELARYKGFVGGVLWLITAMAAAVKMVWPFAKDFLWNK